MGICPVRPPLRMRRVLGNDARPVPPLPCEQQHDHPGLHVRWFCSRTITRAPPSHAALSLCAVAFVGVCSRFSPWLCALAGNVRLHSGAIRQIRGRPGRLAMRLVQAAAIRCLPASRIGGCCQIMEICITLRLFNAPINPFPFLVVC
jgi:hypothetical protein